MPNKLIANNTLYLFIRTGFILAAQLITVRIILNSFGQELFGVYTVLYGVVTIGSLIPSSLISTSQRYLSFSLGQSDKLKSRQSLFTSQLALFFIGALTSVILLDTIGKWFIFQKLGFPSDYANQVSSFFRLTELSILLNILSSPFLGLLIAHENLKIYAKLSSIEPFLKLISALVVYYFSKSNHLTNYGVGLLSSSGAATVIIVLVASLNYKEAIPNLRLIKFSTIQDISRFALWTLFGQVTSASRIQFVTILIYQFFTPAIAASRGLSLTISNQINVLAENLNVSLYGPIVKSFSQNNLNEMFQTIYTGSRLTFLLNSILSIPLIYNTDIILSSWLGKLTPYISILTQLGLWESLLISISFPLMTAARATGKVSEYELKLGIIQTLIPLLTYYAFIHSYPVYYFYFISISGVIIMTILRLFFLKKTIKFNLINYFLFSIIPCTKFLVISSILIYLTNKFLGNQLFQALVSSSLITICTAYILLLNQSEKKRLTHFTKKKLLTLFA